MVGNFVVSFRLEEKLTVSRDRAVLFVIGVIVNFWRFVV